MESAKKESPWYKKWWGIILAILFFPIFIIWYAWGKSSWGKNTKIIVTTLVVLVVIISISSSPETSQNNSSPSPAQTTTQESNGGQEITVESYDSYDYRKDPTYLKPLTVPYDKLFRNIEKYTGKYIRYTGEVIQVLGEPGEQELRVNVTKKGDQYYSYYDDTVYVFSSSPKRVIEKDIIKFKGRVNGTQTYESVLGGEITIPSLTIYEHTLVGHSD
jgi:hypothetical protein